MSRRKQTPTDSLELLLDTMCNAFGGIIMVALLVALMARDARQIELVAPRQIEHSIPALMARAELEQFERLASDLSDPLTRERLALIAERVRLTEQLERMRAEAAGLREGIQDAALSALARPEDQLKELRIAFEQEHRALAGERAAVSELEGQLAMEAAEATSESAPRAAAAGVFRALRLPREHFTEKRPWEFIVRAGRVYPVFILRGGERERNLSGLRWIPAPDGEFIEPVPGAGIDPLMNAAAVSRLYRSVPAQEFYFVFRVYQDSFPAFQAAKELVVRMGHEFTWVPLETGTRLKTGSGTEAPPPL